MNKLNHYYEMFEERAAIMEHDGKLNKDHAEIIAFRKIINRFCQDEDLERDDPETKEFYKGLKKRIQDEIRDRA
tara:strand:+ start:2157 stop:2378 length:222 start_codon:yes stop_codon:yes gene_type:complete